MSWSFRRLRRSRRQAVLSQAVRMDALDARQLFAMTVTPVASGAGTTLSNALLAGNSGLTVTNVSYTGANNQAGTFSGLNLTSGSNTLFMPDGIVLTSGQASGAAGSARMSDTSLSASGDSDLNTLLGSTTYDANVLTIQFTAPSSVKSINFNLLFGSDEFPQYVGSINDGFGAYLDGQQISFDSNSHPISISNNFFAYDNTGGTHYGKTASSFAVGYQGLTQALRTAAPLDGNVTTHTLKLALADAGDDSIDSGVFLSSLTGSTQVLSGAGTGQSTASTAGTLELADATTSVADSAGSVTLTVNRTSGSDGAVDVDYATADGTATDGVDYTATTGTLSFADGETSKTITVPILDNNASSARDFTLTLSNATGGASLGTQTSETVTITHNHTTVGFAAPTYSVNNTAGSVTLTVTRAGNTSAAATVDYSTINSTAKAGKAFTLTSGTLSFAAGQATKTFTIPITNYAGASADAVFKVVLSSPSSGLDLGAQKSTAVTIHNTHTLVAASSKPIVVRQDGSSAEVVLNRIGDLSQAASVAYHTVDGTAGSFNYDAVSGTVNFAAGETSKTITVPVKANPDSAPETNFSIVMSAGDATTVLDPQSEVRTVTLNNDRSLVRFRRTTIRTLQASGGVNLPLVRSGNTASAGLVKYDVLLGSRVNATGTFRFAAGESEKTVFLPLSKKALNYGNLLTVQMDTVGDDLAKGAAVIGSSRDAATVTVLTPVPVATSLSSGPKLQKMRSVFSSVSVAQVAGLEWPTDSVLDA